MVARQSDAPVVIECWVAKAEYELTFASKYDKVIVNDQLETAVKEAYEAIKTFLND